MKVFRKIITYLFVLQTGAFAKKQPSPITWERPQLVQNAFKNNQPIHYFGLGSNMSRKKLENRGLNGTKIDILKMEAAIVPNYRLAFNLRGFPPMEPGMGSLEPVEANSTRLTTYKDAECHGALVKLSPENYEKVMRSEGVGNGTNTEQGYEEIIVQAYPYGSGKESGKPIQAVALRALPHVRLNFDPCPSARYMNILIEGASELNLTPCYQKYLASIPVQQLSPWQKKQALYNLIFTVTLSTTLKSRVFSKFQSRLLFLVYARYSAPGVVKIMSSLLTTVILLPGAIVGFLLKHLGLTPPAVTRIMAFFGE